MTESAFIRSNIKRWQEFERLLKETKSHSPDQLKKLYLQVTDDLSYADTFYPGGEASVYLHQLAHKVHSQVNKGHKLSGNRFLKFWSEDLPLVYYKYRKEVLYSFLVFGLSMLIGAYSASQDATYARLIMGDYYIDMTEENIANNDPMAVYKQAGRLQMSLGITTNNVLVSFYTFALGLFTALGACFSLLRNGIMLGAFQYFFYAKGLLWTSALTIWIHGTLEISAIILAGAAGIVLGNSFIFPGSHSRSLSFQRGARDSLKMILGLVPVFIVAGFLEGYVTRLTEMPDWLKLFIIISSLAFILFYFVLYPKIIHQAHERIKQP